MRPTLALPLLAVFLSSCADSPTAILLEQWEYRDDPAAVRAAQLQQARQNALDEVQGEQDRLQKMKGLSPDDRSRRERRLDDLANEIQSGNWTPTTF